MSDGKKKRNVTIDSNIFVSYVISKVDCSIEKKVIVKSMSDDRLMLTDIIWEEVLNFADSKKNRANLTREDIADRLNALNLKVVTIGPAPSDEKLKEMGYSISKDADLKILYSVHTTNSVILVTRDGHFSGDVKGLTAKVMDPETYIRNLRERECGRD